MDEATLTIRFKDESSPGPAGVATTSPQYSGSDPGTVKVADVQNAITQAGGVGAMAEKNSKSSAGGVSPASPPPVAAASPQPVAPLPSLGGAEGLLPVVREAVQQKPDVTAAEIAAALQINQKQAQTLLNAATVQPGGQSGGSPQPVAPASPPPVAPAPSPIQPPTPPPSVTQPPVQMPAPPQLTREQQLAESERRAPPVHGRQPGQSSPGNQAAHGVQSAVNAIAGIAAQGGPAGAAAGRAVSAAAAIPGVASSLGTAAPVLAAAAPYIAAATAVAAVPAATIAAGEVFQRSMVDATQGYSPEVAQSVAQANVAAMMRNLQTAREYGPQIAAGQRLQQDFLDVTRDLKNSFERFFVSSLEGFQLLVLDLSDPEKSAKRAEELGKADAEVARRKRDAAQFKSMGIKPFDPGSFLNIVPTRPRIPWDEVLPTTWTESEKAAFGAAAFGL